MWVMTPRAPRRRSLRASQRNSYCQDKSVQVKKCIFVARPAPNPAQMRPKLSPIPARMSPSIMRRTRLLRLKWMMRRQPSCTQRQSNQYPFPNSFLMIQAR
ncbi:hypothetical protein RSOL_104640 [Rhizoctonia solani AG-3 Rhs1AP]|uniref:Uncharacterized protein n=1 Tax=Rhizoctonia solani AG-3 Rhs1AP TaxID=1086054 RepID=X8IZQ5_9AGAM|nr:hypothetical protein RSOL_104640 [Rhizoctonia solani AG-3 Rhs1AP]